MQLVYLKALMCVWGIFWNVLIVAAILKDKVLRNSSTFLLLSLHFIACTVDVGSRLVFDVPSELLNRPLFQLSKNYGKNLMLSLLEVCFRWLSNQAVPLHYLLLLVHPTLLSDCHCCFTHPGCVWNHLLLSFYPEKDPPLDSVYCPPFHVFGLLLVGWLPNPLLHWVLGLDRRPRQVLCQVLFLSQLRRAGNNSERGSKTNISGSGNCFLLSGTDRHTDCVQAEYDQGICVFRRAQCHGRLRKSVLSGEITNSFDFPVFSKYGFLIWVNLIGSSANGKDAGIGGEQRKRPDPEALASINRTQSVHQLHHRLFVSAHPDAHLQHLYAVSHHNMFPPPSSYHYSFPDTTTRFLFSCFSSLPFSEEANVSPTWSPEVHFVKRLSN